MLYFLQPVFMWAAAGITIPIVIHLWNVQQGKILKVGSIALLTKDTTRNTSSIKLHELLLLLLRCLLIILLAMLLSQPKWKSTNTSSEKGWVMMDKNDIQQTYTHFKPQVDSLMQAGYEFHSFNDGFDKMDLKDALSEKEDSSGANSISYWGLLSRLNEKLDAKLPVYIFTDNSLNSFTGNRPGVSLNLHWYTYAIPDVPVTTLASAYAIPGDSIRVINAISSATGTVNTYTNIPQSQLKNTGYALSSSDKGLLLSYNNGKSVAVDTSTLSITIFSGQHLNDAVYVKAAIDAIQQFSSRKIVLSVVADAAHVPAQQDWLFWLSEQTMPAIISAKNVFTYEPGKAQDVSSLIKGAKEQALNTGQAALYKYIPAQANDTVYKEPIWQDGFGLPLLNKEEGKTTIYHFYSRFDPSWNELPWSNDFPQMLFGLLYSRDNAVKVLGVNDKRMIDEKQLQPYFVKDNDAAIKKGSALTDISPFIWFAAFAIFFIERFISLRAKKEHRYA